MPTTDRTDVDGDQYDVSIRVGDGGWYEIGNQETQRSLDLRDRQPAPEWSAEGHELEDAPTSNGVKQLLPIIGQSLGGSYRSFLQVMPLTDERTAVIGLKKVLEHIHHGQVPEGDIHSLRQWMDATSLYFEQLRGQPGSEGRKKSRDREQSSMTWRKLLSDLRSELHNESSYLMASSEARSIPDETTGFDGYTYTLGKRRAGEEHDVERMEGPLPRLRRAKRKRIGSWADSVRDSTTS